MGFIDQTPDKESRVELIKTLQTVTEGKVLFLIPCDVLAVCCASFTIVSQYPAAGQFAV